MSALTSLIQWADGYGIQILASLAIWATLVLGVAWLVTRSLRRNSSAVRYCVWQLGLTGLLILPVLVALLPGIPLGFSLAAPDEQPSSVANRDVAPRPLTGNVSGSQPAHDSDNATDFLLGGPETDDVAASGSSAAANRSPAGPSAKTVTPGGLKSFLPWPLLLVCAWGLGLAANLVWLACGAVRVRGLLRNAKRLNDARFDHVSREFQTQLPRDRHVRLLTSPEMHIPAVVGFFRPMILLPIDCTSWSAERIRIVLAHELAHVERRDIFWQLVARVSAALYWFHPLAWLAVSRMREERERSCDDRVLLAGVQPTDYAEGLVEVAAALTRNDPFLIAGIGMASRSGLEKRVRSILDRSSCRAPASARTRRALLAGTAAVVLALGLLRPFSPVSIAAAPQPPAKAVKPADNIANEIAVETEPTAKATNDDAPITIRGRVLDPAGNPIAGATVRLLRQRFNSEPVFKPLSEITSDQEGQFETSYRKSQIHGVIIRAEQWKFVTVSASKPGYGPGWAWINRIPQGEPAELRLSVDDLPITGRLVDLDGRPLAGVKVECGNLQRPKADDLSAWIESVKRGERAYQYLWPLLISEGTGLVPELITDADGRFRLSGVGRERTVELVFSAPSIARTQVTAATRIMPTLAHAADPSPNAEKSTVVGADFEIALSPTRIVEGAVSDAKTGQPLAGVGVQSWKFSNGPRDGDRSIRTVSDAQGHFRLVGMPNAAGNQIVAIPSNDQPYLMRIATVPDEPGLEPVKVELKLHRGIWITGRVTDRVTGKPVSTAELYYLPFLSNESASALPEFARGFVAAGRYGNRYGTAADGTYRLVGLPGPAIVGLFEETDSYCVGQGASEIHGEKDEQGNFLTFRNPNRPNDHYWPNAMQEINPVAGTDLADVDFALDPGGTVEISMVDPAGQPIAGVNVQCMTPRGGNGPVSTPTFNATGFRPTEERTILLRHWKRGLGKAIQVRAADQGKKMAVRLEPFAKITGRLVDQDQKPVTGRQILFYTLPGMGIPLANAFTDAEGRFETSDVVSGLSFTAFSQGTSGNPTIAKELSIEPGETIDLGTIDITTDKRPEPERTKAAG